MMTSLYKHNVQHLTKYFKAYRIQCKLHSNLRRVCSFINVIINSLPHLGSADKPKLWSETYTHMVIVIIGAGSPFKRNDGKEDVVHEVVLQKTAQDIQKERKNELLQKAHKKAVEYQSNKPSSGVFTEVVTHGAFTSKKEKEKSPKLESVPSKTNGGSNSKSLLGFPSSANDLALDAKTDLESDPNISKEVKEKVIEKLFALVSMVQHTYESKVRIMTEFDKFKDIHLKNELRREKEHSEQLYKLNMNFQNEVIQSIQQLKSEIDITRHFSNNSDDIITDNFKDMSLNYDSGVSQTFDQNTNSCDAIE